jgi:hypothetical protein
MYIPFETLPAEARLWLYHIPRPLTAEEKAYLTQKLQQFCETWEAHKKPLNASFALLHGQFIALAVDEAMHGASGCSIDTSVKLMREIGEKLQIDMFKRQYVAYWQDNTLQVSTLPAFRAMGVPATLDVFDQTITTVGALQKRQKINITETWIQKIL